MYAALDAIDNPMITLVGVPNLIYRGNAGNGYSIFGFSILGESLDGLLRRYEFDEITLLLILQKMLRILKYIHGCGVVHNNIQPDTILLLSSELVLTGDLLSNFSK